MKQTIKAGQLTMCVDSMGAEIISLKKGDKDIIWWGDAEYWGEHCPTLFPCIGGNSGGVLRLGGKEYNLKKHGFAKGMEFTLEEATEHSLTYMLGPTEETLQAYPFAFRFFITYELEGDTLHALTLHWYCPTSMLPTACTAICASPRWTACRAHTRSPTDWPNPRR